MTMGTLVQLWSSCGDAHSHWMLPTQWRMPQRRKPSGSRRLWVDAGTPVPFAAACGDLRVVLQSAAGQRTLWSAAGHRGQGWQSGAVPVQSPGAFQVRGGARDAGCRVRCRVA